jgi:hypothetical protein
LGLLGVFRDLRDLGNGLRGGLIVVGRLLHKHEALGDELVHAELLLKREREGIGVCRYGNEGELEELGLGDEIPLTLLLDVADGGRADDAGIIELPDFLRLCGRGELALGEHLPVCDLNAGRHADGLVVVVAPEHHGILAVVLELPPVELDNLLIAVEVFSGDNDLERTRLRVGCRLRVGYELPDFVGLEAFRELFRELGSDVLECVFHGVNDN